MEEKDPEKTELIEESRPPTATNPDTATQSTQARKPARKRTKTGCLTCRRRRIKCGEERPICQNCIKSKRECEGYTQRVISKHPLSMLSNPSLFPRCPPDPNQPRMPFDNPYLTSPAGNQTPAQHQNSLLPLAPRPAEFTGSVPGAYNATLEMDTNFAPGVSGHESSQFGNLSRGHQSESGSPDGSELTVPASNHQPSLTGEPVQPSNPTYTSDGFYQGHAYRTVDQLNQLNQLNQNGTDSPSAYAQDQNGEKGFMSPMKSQQHVPPVRSPLVSPSQPYLVSTDTTVNNNVHGLDRPSYVRTNAESTGSVQLPSNNLTVNDYDMDDYDDYYDVESDEELATERSKNLQTILAISSPGDHHLRSFSTYLNEPNFLTTYRPSPLVSPLMDSKCARIFCHFVASTAPLLSIFERHPINPSVLFTGGSVPLSQQGLWTYTLPMKALEHQGLLHAILAVASLHIARLQQSSTATSHKHYHFALRRVAKALGLPRRRRQVETLAASLLLGFYEVITGEHSKWNSHVSGAAQLLRETDFVGMTRDLRAHRSERQKQKQTDSGSWWGNPSFETVTDDDPFAEKEGNIDESFISILVGRAIRYDEVGVVENEVSPQPKRAWTAKDIDEFRIQSDLHWWYCKQDIIRSMISGNPLMMPFDRWGQCPPRAGFGRLDAVYGTMDHLFLLMARICTFGAMDQGRKVKVMEANGGQYKPPPNVTQPPDTGNGNPNSTLNGGSSTQASQPLAQGVSLGNQPPNSTSDERSRNKQPNNPENLSEGPILQPANSNNPTDRLQNTSSEGMENGSLEAETTEAKAEWSKILAAFEAFAEVLGPGFAPLPPDSVQAITTPFGPAVQYRTHTIAFLMAFYYTGRIMIERLHPDMPPAAMVAAGVAAPQTAEYAQFIGRIAAGLYYPQQPSFPGEGLSPTLGAALADITVALFFAGVQFTDAAQRGWIISKLRDISRMSGWQSAAAIAAGCESAWTKAYQAGKGPPYHRTMDNHSRDSRISGKTLPDPRDQEGRIISPKVEDDRRFVTVDQGARVHWASGILSLDDDFSKIGLNRVGVNLQET